jgi:hypothetical protein
MNQNDHSKGCFGTSYLWNDNQSLTLNQTKTTILILMSRILILSMIYASLSFAASAQNSSSSELFKSSVLTPVNSFTDGVEGPAVDKSGIVYAVNLARQGTIGQIAPAGKTSIFIELPDGSIGNGIRFDSQGNMLIADYTNHNILKVDMKTKMLTIFAHEPRMNHT